MINCQCQCPVNLSDHTSEVTETDEEGNGKEEKVEVSSDEEDSDV